MRGFDKVLTVPHITKSWGGTCKAFEVDDGVRREPHQETIDAHTKCGLGSNLLLSYEDFDPPGAPP